VAYFEELWFVLGEEGRRAGVASRRWCGFPTNSTCSCGEPQLLSQAPVGEHELHVGWRRGGDGSGSRTGLSLVEKSVLGRGRGGILRRCRPRSTGRQWFLAVTAVWGVAFAEEDSVGGEVFEGCVGESVGAVEVVMVAEDLGAQRAKASGRQ